MISDILGRLLNSKLTYKFLCRWLLFPDYHSVSYDYDVNNFVSNIDVGSSIQNPNIEPCICREPPVKVKDFWQDF